MRGIFVSYTTANSTGNAVIKVEDDFTIFDIEEVRKLAEITIAIEPALSTHDTCIISNWKWLPDHPPKETAEEIDRYKKALQEISELPGHRQDEGCNIALNALDY